MYLIRSFFSLSVISFNGVIFIVYNFIFDLIINITPYKLSKMEGDENTVVAVFGMNGYRSYTYMFT